MIGTGHAATQTEIATSFHTTASLITSGRYETQTKKLDRIARTRLLILGQLGYLLIDTDGARLLIQVIAAAYEQPPVWRAKFSRGKACLATVRGPPRHQSIVRHECMLTFKRDSYWLTHATIK